jgi:hypothetical protein
MKKNMGTVDIIIRLSLAALFATLYFTNLITGTWGAIMLVVAVIFGITGVFGFCPLYVPFGISTCPKKKHHKKSHHS